MALRDENGAATQALYDGIFQIGGGLACVVFGVVLVTAWDKPWGWFLFLAGVGLVGWATFDLLRNAKKS